MELEQRLQNIGSDDESKIMAKIGRMKGCIRKGEKKYGTGDIAAIEVQEYKKIKEKYGLTGESLWEVYGEARAALRSASDSDKELSRRSWDVKMAINFLQTGDFLKREWIVRKLEKIGRESPKLARTIYDTLHEEDKKNSG